MMLFFRWTAAIVLLVAAIALLTGTVGGISDNIQFKDWFSVTMWAIFGTLGFAMSAAGAICVINSIFKEE
jgi:hypothetical protein